MITKVDYYKENPKNKLHGILEKTLFDKDLNSFHYIRNEKTGEIDKIPVNQVSNVRYEF